MYSAEQVGIVFEVVGAAAVEQAVVGEAVAAMPHAAAVAVEMERQTAGAVAVESVAAAPAGTAFDGIVAGIA